jgi:hypothetical protein
MAWPPGGFRDLHAGCRDLHLLLGARDYGRAPTMPLQPPRSRPQPTPPHPPGGPLVWALLALQPASPPDPKAPPSKGAPRAFVLAGFGFCPVLVLRHCGRPTARAAAPTISAKGEGGGGTHATTGVLPFRPCQPRLPTCLPHAAALQNHGAHYGMQTRTRTVVPQGSRKRTPTPLATFPLGHLLDLQDGVQAGGRGSCAPPTPHRPTPLAPLAMKESGRADASGFADALVVPRALRTFALPLLWLPGTGVD